MIFTERGSYSIGEMGMRWEYHREKIPPRGTTQIPARQAPCSCYNPQAANRDRAHVAINGNKLFSGGNPMQGLGLALLVALSTVDSISENPKGRL
jgi:hypothetical protein